MQQTMPLNRTTQQRSGSVSIYLLFFLVLISLDESYRYCVNHSTNKQIDQCHNSVIASATFVPPSSDIDTSLSANHDQETRDSSKPQQHPYQKDEIKNLKNNTRAKRHERVLSNGNSIPLIGIGVGNLPRHLVDNVVMSSLNMGFRLVDTARASKNEHVIARSVAKHSFKVGSSLDIPAPETSFPKIVVDDRGPIHIITKVWYTHLGYERTRISVQESMEEITSAVTSFLMESVDSLKQGMNVEGVSAVDIRLHVLLHWPRCNEKISWMRCQEEEEALPQYVKDAGPPPHLDKKNAWKGSWRALEDLYLDQERMNVTNSCQGHDGNDSVPCHITLESIGVSNFEYEDMKELLMDCRVKPSMYQGNVWIVMHNTALLKLLKENDVLFQAYNVMHGALQRRNDAPIAFSVLTEIGKQLTRTSTSLMDSTTRQQYQPPTGRISEAMVIMAWLVQEGISIIPRASSSEHQIENSPFSMESVPKLTREEKEQVKAAVSALMRGDDIKVEATFQNKFNVPIQIHWSNGKTGEESPVTQPIEPGEASTIQTHPGHMFVAYDEGRNWRKEFQVTVGYGKKEHFTVMDEL